MFKENIWVVAFSILAIILWVISVQEKKQYKILFLEGLANLAYTISYFLLGAYTPSSMNFVSTIRCFIFSKDRKENKDIPGYYLAFFLILLVVFGFITFRGFLSLIPIIITAFYTISSYLNDSKYLRIVFLVMAFVWIFYNYMVGAYVCIIGNVLEIISGVISLIRFKK